MTTYSYKIILLGNSGVGKTSFYFQFFNKQFFPCNIATIGFDYSDTTIKVKGTKVKIKMFDTAGQEKLKALTNNYYKNADGVILMYAVDDRQSFDEIKEWLSNIKEQAKKEIVIVLVANKNDLENSVHKEEGKKLAESNDLQFFQISSINLKEVQHVVNELVANLLKNEDADTISDITLNDNSKSFKGKCC